ncbi:MAG: hypothetical protein DRQ61_09910 [Gammaproteobacteria bacterium]|nr:MAG: hypothetical protein DRQ61_09910 [Gammaproteobacteria bacterium]
MKIKDDNVVDFIRFAFRLIIFSIIGVYVLFINPFGISDKTDEATQNAFYRIISPNYEISARENIVVVLIDSFVIENLHNYSIIGANEWPLLYSDHAYLLSHISRYSPRAIFVDIYFKKERSTDGSFPDFIRKLERLKSKYSTQFLFAGGTDKESFSEMQNSLDSHFGLTVNGWAGHGHDYLLKGDISGKPTVALALYERACLSGKPLSGCDKDFLDSTSVHAGDTLSVRWGSTPAPDPLPEFVSPEYVCSSGSRGSMGMMLVEMGWRFAQGLFKGLYGSESTELEKCGFHSILYMDDLVLVNKNGSKGQKEKLAKLLGDNVVIYGMSLKGLDDNFISPVHGKLPGVMLHAMALDNLMLFGEDYTKGSDDWIDMISIYSWLLMAFCLASGMYGCDRCLLRKQPDNKDGCYFRVAVFTAILVAVFSLVIFLHLHYAPLNAIGYGVLFFLIFKLVDSDVINRAILWFLRKKK